MGKNLTCEDREQIAYKRYQVILPLVKSDFDEKTELIIEVAEKENISIRTLWRWIKDFTIQGLKGLMPKERSDKGKIRVISENRLNRAIELKKEIPQRSVRKVVRLMELSDKVHEGEIKVSTLTRIFRQQGYTKQELLGILPKKVRGRFERDEPNSLWQGDYSDAIWLDDPKDPSKMKKTFLNAFIDDASRFVPWGEFFWDEKLPSLEITFKKGIERCGVPGQVYIDGAKVYSSEQYVLICAELAVEILVAPDAASKGKIEAFNKTVQNDFYPEVIHAGITTLEELNKCFWLWLDQEYHKKVHSETGKRPIDAFNEIKNVGRVEKGVLDRIFLWRDKRTVNKETCLIPYETNHYEVIPALRGKRVQIRFNPFDLSKIYVYYNGEFQCMAIPYHMIRSKHSKVKSHKETRFGEKNTHESSISYFKALEKKSKEEKSELSAIQKVENPKDSKAIKDNIEIPSIETTTAEEFLLKFHEIDFYNLMHEKLGRFTSNERKKVKSYWKEYGPFDEKLTTESIDRSVSVKGKSQNISYYLESIRREHFRRVQEMDLYHKTKRSEENKIKLASLVNELTQKMQFPK